MAAAIRKAPARRPATARTPADRKIPASKVVKPAPDLSLVEIVSGGGQDVPDVPVFSLDGVVYSMPGVIPASMALEALDRFRHEGELGATAWMLEEVLGTETYDVLKSCKALTSDQLTKIMDRVSEHVMGGLENSGN